MQPPFLNIICITYKRRDLYKKLLRSVISELKISSRLFVRFILIDQNKKNKYVRRYKFKNLLIEIYGSEVNGVSASKNIALKKIIQGYVWFLDDDCLVPKGAFLKIIRYINEFPNGFSFIANNIDSEPLRKWPKHLHAYNFISKWYLSFTINTIFPYKLGMFHDLKLGPPNNHGSCEDVDFSIRYFDNITFLPVTLIAHNDPRKKLEYEKIYKYSKGFGYLCRKHLPVGFIFIIFSMLILVANFFRHMDFTRLKFSIRGRLEGFFRIKID